MSTVKQLLTRGSVQLVRKLEVKRIEVTGLYESDWLDISDYVMSWGQIRESFGDTVYLSDFTIDDLTLVLDNSSQYFNETTDYHSMWYRYMTRFRTKWRISVYAIDDDDSEVLLKRFHGLNFSNIIFNDTGSIEVLIASFLKIFQYYFCDGLASTGAKTDALVTRITDKASSTIFDRIFDGYSINPDAVVCLSITAPTFYDATSCWEKIQIYSTLQDFFPYVNSSAEFVWKGRGEGAVSQWTFNGSGSNDADYGVNIRDGLIQYDGIESAFPRVVIEFEPDTYATVATSYTVADGSLPDQIGEQTFSYTAEELSSAEATAVATLLHTAYGTIKKYWRIPCAFIPQLVPGDKITINYKGEISISDAMIWGISKWGQANWGGYTGSIYIDNQSAKITEVNIDLDSFNVEYLAKGI